MVCIYWLWIGLVFSLLEKINNLENVKDLGVNGLKYLVVTFCIVYDLQKMLGCTSFTLEMQVKNNMDHST